MKLGFKGMHPLSEFFFYLFAFAFGLISSHPLCLITGLLCAFFYDFKLRGRKTVDFFIRIIIPLIILSGLINGLVSHFGETVLFNLPWNKPFTLESVIYGIVFSLKASSTLLWLNSFNEVVSSDKIVYLFGKFSPKIALIISMSLRFIPLITEQSSNINTALKGIGASEATLKFTGKIKSAAKRLSVLVSWSLERGIDTSSSMKARGYGLKGRTVYNPYGFSFKDILLIFMLLTGCAAFFLSGKTLTATYNPETLIPFPDIKGFISWTVFTVILLFPLILDFSEEKKWSISV